MKFDCGPTEEERREAIKAQVQALQEWHPFFAIWPRQVGSHDCRMLETVERRLQSGIRDAARHHLECGRSIPDNCFDYRPLTKK